MRPFEVKVKLWVSKFIFFHADSGIGLKHNFEAVFEAVRGCFVILKPVKGLQKEINFWHPSSVPILFWLFKLTEVLPCEFRPFWHIIHTCRGFVVISVEIRGRVPKWRSGPPGGILNRVSNFLGSRSSSMYRGPTM